MQKKKNKKSVNKHNHTISNVERMKGLSCINMTTKILRQGIPVAEALKQICSFMPKAWQYPDYTVVRINIDDTEIQSDNFKETKWKLATQFETIDNQMCSIEVYYLEEFADLDDGPFLNEERKLINDLGRIIRTNLNSITGRKSGNSGRSDSTHDIRSDKNSSSSHMLQRLLNKHNTNRDIFHDLMPYKVNEILLVATLYDAYSIEKEGRFTNQILGEYHQLNLTTMPRVTAVSSAGEAMENLRIKHFDLVIIMLGADKYLPVSLSEQIKEEFSYIQVFLLLNNSSDINYFPQNNIELKAIDKTFVWNGDSKVFFAMVKSVEDWVNLENDTAIGMVGVILLVEDSPKYYSRYLPLLYHIVMEQTKRLIEEVNVDELFKVLRLRARPKIILASNYEEAMYVFSKYRDYMLCLITDMKYNKDGRPLENAGELLIRTIQEQDPDLAAIIQSSDPENEDVAKNLGVKFINKNSGSLIRQLRSFLKFYLGFGDFVYMDKTGKKIGVATTLSQFENHLKTIPDDSLLYHATRNHFSQWLMARGEIHIARIIHPVRSSDFKSVEALRSFLIHIIQTFRHEQKIGRIVPFFSVDFLDERNIVSLATGALGGKGRGLAFIQTLIYNFDFSALIKDINIRSPRTTIIGTDEYEQFMEDNDLYSKAFESQDYDEIKKCFVEADLSSDLTKKLRMMLEVVNKPLAVRSSGLFEDSLTRPFAGIFETYKLPNNHTDIEVRIRQLSDAIKLVYASVFSNLAKGYLEAVNHKIEEEKMAVGIQEVVGNQWEDYYYPHISGVAQSYNYYPYSYMKPEEGFVVSAVGLGKYVVDGEKAFRFSPKYPDTTIKSPKDQVKDSQVKFWAVDMAKSDVNLINGPDNSLIKLDIDVAERHGALKHCASVFDYNNDRITPGLSMPGPRLINFANILKYNYIPMAKTIEVILNVVKEAMGTPVEIEYAIDLNKDKNGKASFYLLQIKPLIGSAQDFNIDMEEHVNDDILLYSENCMGNGKVDNLTDVIYVDNDVFDKTDTIQMINEIEKLNAEMNKLNKKYILIGPGRWGTRDRFIGIPVNWPQISNAKIIVETSLKEFPLDASLGSHFFHNVTSMDVGYFSIQPELSGSYINYDALNSLKLIKKTKYFRHVRFDSPVIVRMDGKKRISLISIQK